MCGIMARLGKDSIGKVLGGLSKLEYRGYDSCGIAYKNGHKVDVVKSVGYIETLKNKVGNAKDSMVAIGHTRWATHGGVTENNSHPHMSASGRFAIVHNGILENYKEIKSEYLSDVKFISETDSEVIAQLMDYFYVDDIMCAFKKTISLLKGSYAIVLMSSIDNSIYFARHSSPMVVAKVDDGFELASDINGLSSKENICYIDDDSMGIIDKNIHIFDNKYNEINPTFVNKTTSTSAEGLGKYNHYMHKEIYEIPESLKRSYHSLQKTKFELPSKIDNVLIVGCGTSYHSGLMGSKYIEEFAGIPCECVIASEFIYNHYVSKPGTLGIFISQSGETADTLSALRRAKEMGIFSLAITNVENSSITRLSDTTLLMQAGAEICVASTKAYTTQVFYLLMLSNILINLSNGNYLSSCKSELVSNSEMKDDGNVSKRIVVEPNLTQNFLKYNEDELQQLFDIDITKIESEINKVVGKFKDCKELHIIGKGYDYITAMESALKIKEVSYIFTDAYPSGELKHGTLSLIDKSSWVILINTQEELLDKGNNAIHEIVSRGGKVVAVSQLGKNIHGVDFVISIENVARVFLPIVAIIPIDLLAYKLSLSRGNNPDKPRNLAKSVTVE